MNIPNWLESIGLPMYAKSFSDHAVDTEMLLSLKETDLEKFGVLPVHRRRILGAIELLPRETFTARPTLSPTAGDPGSATAAAEAERRQLTIMYCDLVDSTKLSELLDPEDLREVLRTYQESLTLSVASLEGHVANLIGDGVLACFGYPIAHEDDAARAVLAGLEILQKLSQINIPLGDKYGIEISVRIGVHTGVVVVGDIGGQVVPHTNQIVGTAPNVAARLQAIATPNTLVISDSTMQLIQGQFDCRELGSYELKGVADPVLVHEVQSTNQVRNKFEVLEKTELTPLIGRDRDIRLLADHWDQSQSGNGKTVVLIGEPGIGKSRIIRAFKDKLEGDAHLRYLYFCSAHHVNTALHPIVEQLTRALDIQRSDNNSTKMAKLENSLRQTDLPLDDFIPYLAPLLSLELQTPYSAPALTPKQLKQRIFERLIQVVEAAAARQTVLIVVEDLHWADASTLELMDTLIRRVAQLRVLMICSVRSPPSSPWTEHDDVTLLHLRRLRNEESVAMASSVAVHTELPPNVISEIITKSDGNPLFIEELTKWYISKESTNTSKTEAGTVPTTLRDSLTARLDRLGFARTVAQFCSTIGRRFQQNVVLQMCPFPEEQLRSGIDQLLAADVLLQHGGEESIVYEFKHALLQDAAYDTLLKSKRRAYHRHIAEVLERTYPDVAELEPELVAHHYTQAGVIGLAISYWEKAGKRAIDRSANVEAVAQLQQGLNLIAMEKESVERDKRELMLLVWLGTALTASNSYANEDVGRTYSRARVLCERLGGAPQLFPVISGLYRFYFVRSELGTALNIARQMLEVAERVQDPSLLLEAHRSIGFCLAFQGQLNGALEHIERSLSLFDAERDADHRFVYGTDAMVASLSVRATVLWLQGYPEQATENMKAALLRAREINHPFTEAWSLTFAAVIFELIGDDVTSKAHAERCIEIATKHEFPFWLAGGTIMRGSAIFRGERDETRGVELMRQGLDAWRATGAEIYRPYFVLLLAKAYGQLGKCDEAIELVDSSLSEQGKHNEVWMAAETHRVRAELIRESCLKQGNCDALDEAINSSLLKAKDIARSQAARALELRTQMSLLRQRRESGAPLAPEREALRELCQLFEERGQSSDLEQAEQLLADTR